ncbi:hypothetical protein V6N13_028401 [Hibiscus sabdariffa]
MRLSWWCKALWLDVTPAITDVVASPIRLTTVKPRLKNKEVHGWIAHVKGVNNVLSREILPIKEALRLYNSVKGSHSYTVVFECDNQSVVGWLQHPHLAPVNIKEEIVGCISECKDLDCRFLFVSREGNTVADGLAKKGIRRVQPLVVSCFTGLNQADGVSLKCLEITEQFWMEKCSCPRFCMVKSQCYLATDAKLL